MSTERLIENERGQIEFIRHKSGSVHVTVQRGPYYDPNPEFSDRWERATRRHVEQFGTFTDAELLAFRPEITLCGQLLYLAEGLGCSSPDCFDDDELCRACHRALGAEAGRAFEHCRPGDPECEHPR